MKILLDVLGGDFAPNAALDAAKIALAKDPSLELGLIGPKEVIEKGVAERQIDASRIEIIEASDAVTNEDHPANFLREKPNSSMAIGFKALAEREDLAGMVSSGPTGALLVGATLRVGRLPLVKRPALIATAPTKGGNLVRILDAGANMDAKPEYLVQFAKMANAYLQELGYASPRIGLLSVGMEEGKGDERTKETYAILKSDPSLRFVGNIEADKVLDDLCDILVTDGFAGNVFIKATEGAALFVSGLFKKALKRNFLTKLGALFQMKGLKEAKKPFKTASAACAPLLGCKKLVVKCHGKADAETLANGIAETKRFAEGGLLKKVADSLQ